MFWLGCQRELDYSDLYVHPSEADSEKLLRRFSRSGNIIVMIEFNLKPNSTIILLLFNMDVISCTVYVLASTLDAAHMECMATFLFRFWAIELERKRQGGKPRLMVALMKCFWWRLVLQGLSILIEVLLYIIAF